MKQAKGFSTQFLGQCLPKNALYFRAGKYVAYCDNFAQFSKGYTMISIHVMDLDAKKPQFKHVVAKRTDIPVTLFEREVEARNLYGIKCVNVLCINRGGVLPELRTPALQKVRMKPDASGTITDSSLEKEYGSFVGSAIMHEYATCIERKVSRQNFMRAPYAIGKTKHAYT